MAGGPLELIEHRRTRGSLAVRACVLLVLVVPSCRTKPAPPERNPDDGPPPALGFTAATTDGPSALENLHGRIQSAEEALASRPAALPFRQALVESLLSRVAFAGSFADLGRVDDLTAEALAASPRAPEAHQMRARYLSAVHEFDQARDHLTRAQALGASLAGEETGYWLAEGRNLEEARWIRADAAARFPSFTTLSQLAVAEAALGHFARADQLFLEALEHYRDVSPFPVSWAFFQRGLMWAEMADRPDWARPLYAEAARRLPGYVTASVHLAELEWEAGEKAAALDRLRGLAETTQDPEPWGKLAQWLSTTDPEAKRFHARARDAYEALLARHPWAFLDHASEFFREPGGDPLRALALAERNLERRQNARAFLLGLEAALAAGRRERACELLRRVPPEVLPGSRPLAKLVEAERRRCPG